MFYNFNKKIFHILAIVLIIFVIVCIAGILIIRYEVEGESNMPFIITKISLLESVEGNTVDGSTERWNLNVNQNNDIYIYIEKNPNYGKTEVIDYVEISNIVVDKENEKGETKLYKPVSDEKTMFINSEENEIDGITYKGDLQSSIKEQKISNQGGIVAFRYGLNNVAQYVSEVDEQIDYSQLLKLTNVTNEDLQAKLSFNIDIKLVSGKKYHATINLDFPVDDIIENGLIGKDITDVSGIIFKRIENL